MVLWDRATAGYGFSLDDFAIPAGGAHLAGKNVVGRGVFAGTGASVCPGVCIGAESVIGAGAAVTQDIPDRVITVGVLDRVSRQIDNGFDWYGWVLSGTRLGAKAM